MDVGQGGAAAGPSGLRVLGGTVASVAGFNVGVGLGAVLGALYGNRRFGIDVGVGLGCDSALALAGVRLSVQGEHNLWGSRPAVFVGNHQSNLDPLILAALVRRDFTTIGKQESRYDPRAVLSARLLDVALIDRSDRDGARHSVNALVERIAAGSSVVLFPEGTRSPTSVPGPFKKGAFHLAMQAKVPIVPVVIRNAGELMPKGSWLTNPGTVDVCVHEPIPTDTWLPEEIGGHVARVRDIFVDTLNDWPGTAPHLSQRPSGRKPPEREGGQP